MINITCYLLLHKEESSSKEKIKGSKEEIVTTEKPGEKDKKQNRFTSLAYCIKLKVEEKLLY